MQAPPLGLYIHLPWCERKCPYCDFNSHERRDLPQADYVDALLRDLRRDLVQLGDRTIETLFIGGGTPSLFAPQNIETLLAGIADLAELAPDFEATMEANPGSAEADRFSGYAQAGINRLSLGIQSFDNACLDALGRIHDSEAAHAAIEYARAANFNSINIDLMHGLPGQTPATAAADLEAAIAHQTQHLSWYQLTIEANTVFYKQPPVLPNEDNLADIQQAGEALIAAAGFVQYEVSAFSRAGFQCRHNLNYWRFGDYLGIGAGAHAKLSGESAVIRTAKRRQPEDYLAAQDNFVANSRILDRDDLIGEFMLNALRLNEGFDASLFTRRTGLDITALEPQLSTLLDRELMVLKEEHINTTELGRRFLNDVMAGFLPE